MFAVEGSSRDLLEREYLFIDVVSTFLRAIRCGAIHIHHGAVILAHYGRLELAFDSCSRVVIDVLREENVMKNEPHVIVTTVTQALQEVIIYIAQNTSIPNHSTQAYTLLLDGIVRDESNATQLAKLLPNCFIVRGNQLSIVRRLPSQYIIQVQTNLLSWLGKRIAAYQNANNKKSFKFAIGFFKVLIPLLGTLGSRDALKM